MKNIGQIKKEIEELNMEVEIFQGIVKPQVEEVKVLFNIKWKLKNKMNIEFEVKNVIRDGGTNEEKAERICGITNFSKDKIIKALNKGGETTSDVYWNIVMENKK